MPAEPSWEQSLQRGFGNGGAPLSPGQSCCIEGTGNHRPQRAARVGAGQEGKQAFVRSEWGKGPTALLTQDKAALGAHTVGKAALPLRAARESSAMIQVKNFLERKQAHGCFC